MSISGFVVSIVASLVAGVVLVLGTALVSSRARWILTGILGRLLDVDIDHVFSDKKSAEHDVQRELRRARDVAIMTSRGNELQRDTFDPLFLQRPAGAPLRVRLLLPDTAVAPDRYDWTAQREHELATFDRAFGQGLLRQQIENNVGFLQGYIAAGQAELRRFNYPHLGRVLVTERCAYFTPYRADSHGRDSVVYKYRRGEMYDSLKRLFEQLWDREQEGSIS